jgi:N-acetylmuramoyl-L-alanine amidase
MEKTKAEVVMITKEPSLGFESPDRDRLRDLRGRVLLTEPAYRLNDPVVGVNLRWYLANSWLRRPGRDKKPVPPERTVFLSLHADSLHPSVRGAMAYVPGERFLRDKYGKKGTVYANYREWKEEPSIDFNRKERVAAEGVSTVLAARLLTSIRDAGLPVHPFSPIRTHVIRGGREWVPAVLRYNRVPGRVLLEIANLSNDHDRALTITRKFRQSMAQAIGSGIIDYFQTRHQEGGALLASTRQWAPAPEPRPERSLAPLKPSPEPPAPSDVQGPWPPVYGPQLPAVTGKPKPSVTARTKPRSPSIKELGPASAVMPGRGPAERGVPAKPSPEKTARPSRPQK